MSNTLGDIKGQMILDVKQALNAYTAVRQQHVSTVTALATGGGAIATAGAMIAGAGVAIGAGLMTAVGAAAEFERKLDYFTAVGGPDAAKNYDAVRAKALQLGQDTIFSANQIADSFVELAKSGVGAKDIINGIGEGVAALGAAADIPLDTAANIITAAVATFHLGADQAVSVANQLAGAANASIIDVQDLGVSLKYAGGVAAGLKVPFQDVNTALAIMGVNGIKGSTAGTSLRQVLLGLQGGTKKARAELETLGIITKDGSNQFFNANGTAKSLAEVFQILQDRTKGLSDQQRIQAFQTIFATRALPSLIALTNAGADGFAKMSAEIGKTTALDVASQRLDNLSGDVEILRGNLDTLAVTVGSKLQAPARAVVQMVTNLVGAIANLPGPVLTVIASVAALGSAFLIALGFFGVFAGFMLNIIELCIRASQALVFLAEASKIAAKAIQLLTLAFIPGPLKVILVILALIAGALVIFFTQTQQGQAVWAQLMATFQQGLALVVPLLTQLAGILTGWLSSALQVVMPLLVALGNFLMSVLAPFLPIITNMLMLLGAAFSGIGATAPGVMGFAQVFTQILSGIISAIPIILQAILQLAIMIVQSLVGAIPLVMAAGLQMFLGIVNAIVAVAPTILTAIVQLVVQMLTALISMAPTLIQAGLTLITGLITAIVTLLPVIIAAVINLITSVIAALVMMVPTLIQAAIQLFTGILQALVTMLPQIINGIVQLILGIVQAVITMIPVLIQAAIQLFMSLLDALIQIIPMLITTIIQLIPTIIGTLITLIPALLNGAIQLFLAIVKALPKIIPQLITAIIGLIPVIIKALIQLIPQLIQAGITLFMGLVSAIGQAVPAIISALASLGQQMINGLVNGIKNMAGKVINIVKDVIGGAVNFAKGLLGIKSPSRVFMGIGSNTILGLVKGIGNERNTLNRQMASVVNDLTAFYQQVGAAAALDASLNVGTTIGVETPSLQAQLDSLSGQLQTIAEKDTFNVEKLEVNNPEPEPVSESLPDVIRKTAYMVG